MSEKIPASEGPKPGPPKPEHSAGPLRTVFGTTPEAAPENTIPFAPAEEQMQPELASEVNAIEDIAVEEPVETTTTVEAPILESETPAESPSHESDLDTLEAMFNQPAAPEAKAIEVVQTTPQEKVIDEVQPKPEASPFNFVDKRNAASKEWSKDAHSKVDSQDTKSAATVAEVAPVAHKEAAKTPEVPAPKRGELSHHDYHAQRPSEGVYRVGNGYKHTSDRRFVTKEQYENQTGIREYPNGDDGIEVSSQKHYDEVTGLNEAQEATPERPSYESMDTDQLIFAYAKAEMIGDKFVTDDIRNVYTTAMEEAYTKPGSLISYEEHQEALERFDRMTEAAIQYEKAKDPEHSALVDAAIERANKEPSIGDKLKKLWNKGKEKVKLLFRKEYWGERFTNASLKVGEASTWALNLGVNEEDDDQEKDRKRNRNRVLFIAGGAAVAVASIAGAYGIGYAIGGGGSHGAATEALTSGNGSGRGVGEALSAHDRAIADSLTPTRGSDIPVASPVPTPEASIPVGYDVPNGEGGEQLFNTIGIDPQKWYANQESFLRNFPDQFYRMPGGDVGIAQPGTLPLEVRNAMEALK